MGTEKLVLLKLIGDIKPGVSLSLEIGPMGRRPDIELRGYLPENAELGDCLREWRKQYRSQLSYGSRLKPGKISYDTPLSQFGRSSTDCRQVLYLSKELERIFKEWLKSESFQAIEKQIREELDFEEEVQFIIQSENDKIHCLPWTSWDLASDYKYSDVASSPSVFRRSERDEFSKLPGEKKVRILAVLGDQGGINLKKDCQELKRLDRNRSSSLEVDTIFQPTLRKLSSKLEERPWDILFFAGHSETREQSAIIHINSNESISLSEIKKEISKAVDNGLQIAIFNSCDGLGLARELANLHIPYLIVMKELIPDKVAQKFLEFFLEDFSSDPFLPLHRAMRSTREKLQALEQDFPCATWLPVIFQNPTELSIRWTDLRNNVYKKDRKEEPVRKIHSNPNLNLISDDNRQEESVRKIHSNSNLDLRSDGKGSNLSSFMLVVLMAGILAVVILPVISPVISAVVSYVESKTEQKESETLQMPNAGIERPEALQTSNNEIFVVDKNQYNVCTSSNHNVDTANFKDKPNGKQIGIIEVGQVIYPTGRSEDNFYEIRSEYQYLNEIWESSEAENSSGHEKPSVPTLEMVSSNGIGWIHGCWLRPLQGN